MTIKELIDNQKVGWSLHQRFYTDPDIYEAELDHIITKNWIMICLLYTSPSPRDS